MTKRAVLSLSSIEQIDKCQLKCVLDETIFSDFLSKKCRIRFLNGEFICKNTADFPAFVITSDLILDDSSIFVSDYSYADVNAVITETISTKTGNNILGSLLFHSNTQAGNSVYRVYSNTWQTTSLRKIINFSIFPSNLADLDDGMFSFFGSIEIEIL